MKNMYADFMLAVRIATLIAVLTFGVFFILAGAHAALAGNISLKRESIVEGDSIVLGDLFTGLTGNADYVLGPAPQPGQDMTLDARTLMRVAISLDLPWRPATSADTVTLRRAATTVGEDVVTGAIEDSLREQGVTGRFEVGYQSATAPRFVLPGKHPANVEVSDMKVDPQKGLFHAVLSSPSAGNPVLRQSVSGSIRRIVEVPVLKSTLRNGDVIGAHDIQWIDMYGRDLQSDYILSEDSLIGRTPRRMAMAGKPLRDIDVESPRIVQRGEEITIVYAQGGMTLTAKGKASQDGAKGEIVRVVNVNSNRAVDGTVTGEREVTVQ